MIAAVTLHLVHISPSHSFPHNAIFYFRRKSIHLKPKIIDLHNLRLYGDKLQVTELRVAWAYCILVHAYCTASCGIEYMIRSKVNTADSQLYWTMQLLDFILRALRTRRSDLQLV